MQRDAYLRDACGSDSGLRREVAGLLAHHTQSVAFEPWAASAAARLMAAPAPLQFGQLLGPYRIDAFVAAGGMGQVYRATDMRLNRTVAIKICAGTFSDRFTQEAHAIASLNHPYICHLYDVGPNYLVMEFVDGVPLRGPLPLKQAIDYAGQILDALNAAHRKGITHRDLKPGNILVTRQGIKLLDFGLAKRTAPLQHSDATVTLAVTGKGEILGTLHYMSPEQLQGKDADARSDIFSFGCVLYEMLSGKRAFEAENLASVIAAILQREPAPLDVAPPLDRVIRTCLEKDADQRFQNALDLKRAFTWAMEQPASVQPNRRAWIAAAIATLVVGAFGGWAVFHLRSAPAGDRVLRLKIDPPSGGRFFVGGTLAGDPAISPDGRMAAFVALVNGKIGIWVRSLDGTTARLLPGTQNAGQPIWSPDSRSVAFYTGTRLRRVNVDGGTTVEILNVVRTLRGASWGTDGYILFSQIDRSPLSSGYSIYRVSEAGGTPSLVAAPQASHGELSFRWPQALPDGRFMYCLEAARPEDSGAFAASLANPGDRVKLVGTESKVAYASGPDGQSYLLWMRGTVLLGQEFNPHTLRLSGQPREIADLNAASQGEMHITVSATGLLLYGTADLTQLAWWDRNGKQLNEAGEAVDGIVMFRLSPDERQIAVQRATAEAQDLWLFDADRRVSTRLTADRTISTQPVWSRDGRTILYTHLGSSTLFRKLSSGAGEKQVVIQRSNNSMPYDWSRDGHWVLLREMNPDTKYDIWKLPITSDGKLQEGITPTPYLQTPFNEQMPRFSPEASPRWVAYVSDDSGRPEVYIDAFPEPRGKKRISTNGGQFPEWGAGGRELFYVSPDNQLMAVSLTTGPGLQPSSPRTLFPLPQQAGFAASPYQPGRDGQRFLVLTSPEVPWQALTVIVNWPALIKQRSAAP